MEPQRIKFIYGVPSEFGYLHVDLNGNFIKLTDLDGNEVCLDNQCGYECI
jgi:hypothetical protein